MEPDQLSTFDWLVRGLGVFLLIFSALMARSALRELWAWARERLRL